MKTSSLPSRTRPRLERREARLLAALVLWTLLALLVPGMQGKAAGGTLLAEARAWTGLPNVLDVLTNLPMVAIGLLGLRWLHWLDRLHERTGPGAHAADELPVNALDCGWLFFAGLVLAAVGSVFYNLQPDALRLAADRAAMAVAFAGIMGMAVCDRVSPRAGWPAAWFVLAAGLLAVAVYHDSGNVMPWAIVQFGGMALMTVLALTPSVGGSSRPLRLKLGWIVFFYALGKVFELGDEALLHATHHVISGQSLKQLASALAALPVLHAVQAAGRSALQRQMRGAVVTA